MKARRRARAAVLQALYEVDFTNHQPEEAIQARLEEKPLPQSAVEFAHHLTQNVYQRRSHLDEVVGKLAPEWPIDQIAAIDRNVLRIAVYELLFEPDTPPKVAINEAVELAKMFGAESSARFVNGVLGSLATSEPEPGQKRLARVKQ